MTISAAQSAFFLSRISRQIRGQLCDEKATWASRFQIPSAPPPSTQIFGDARESLEICACARDLRSCADPENAPGGPNPQNLANPIRARFC